MTSGAHHRLLQLLRPPVFNDADATRRADLLNIVLWIGLAQVSVQLANNLFSGAIYAAIRPVLLGMLACNLIAMLLMRRRRLAAAAWLWLIYLLVGVTLLLARLGSVNLPSAGVYMIAVLTAGLLLTPRQAIAYAILTIAAVIGLNWLEFAGQLPPVTRVQPLTRSITYAAMYATLAAIVYLTRRHSDSLLQRAEAELAERRKAEEALRSSRAHLLGLLAAVPDFIFIADGEGVYHEVYTGYQNVLGIPPEALRGRSVFDLHPPEQAQAFLDVLQRALSSREVIDYEYSLPLGATPGERRWYSARVVAFDAAEGRRVLWLARDITAAQRSARALQELTADLEQRVEERTARLEEANRELEGFAYSISHDLRSPLRAVDGYARLLAEDYGPSLPDDARQMLDMLRKGAAAMNARIDELLQLAQLADRPLRLQTVAMRALAETAACSLLGAGEEQRQIDLQIDDMPPAQADATLLERVYTILFDNAIKFTTSVPVARIHAGALPGAQPQCSQLSESQTIYFVRDNGIGFDHSDSARIFTAFQRLNAAPSEGSRLGLAVARRIIERHGGCIWAEGQPGKGAVFYFTLPEPAGQEATRSAPASARNQQ